jgi:1-acyl-sn-glycerol-3-phosphate acyltransferase
VLSGVKRVREALPIAAAAAGTLLGTKPGGDPADQTFRRLMAAFRPFELIMRPRLECLERVPADRPLMFIGNHQLLALDSIFLMTLLWRERGIALRPLGDDFLFRTPLFKHLMHWLRVEPASPEACERLMREGACLLVYPGGAREAAKGRSAPLSLDWWDRLGFARMALRHGCTIVPVAATGIDDRITLLLTGDDLMHSPLGRVIDGLGLRHDLLPPLFYPRALPRVAFRFGEPIRMDSFAARDPDAAQRVLRSEVARSIERELEALKRSSLA